MLNNLNEEVSECLQHAENCARQAATETDPKLKEDFLALERSWLSLAPSYEFTAMHLRFCAARPFIEQAQQGVAHCTRRSFRTNATRHLAFWIKIRVHTGYGPRLAPGKLDVYPPRHRWTVEGRLTVPLRVLLGAFLLRPVPLRVLFRALIQKFLMSVPCQKSGHQLTFDRLIGPWQHIYRHRRTAWRTRNFTNFPTVRHVLGIRR